MAGIRIAAHRCRVRKFRRGLPEHSLTTPTSSATPSPPACSRSRGAVTATTPMAPCFTCATPVTSSPARPPGWFETTAAPEPSPPGNRDGFPGGHETVRVDSTAGGGSGAPRHGAAPHPRRSRPLAAVAGSRSVARDGRLLRRTSRWFGRRARRARRGGRGHHRIPGPRHGLALPRSAPARGRQFLRAHAVDRRGRRRRAAAAADVRLRP